MVRIPTDIFMKGFYFFKGATLPEKAMEFFKGLHEHPKAKTRLRGKEASTNSMVLEELPDWIIQNIFDGLPENIRHILEDPSQMRWRATSCGYGMWLPPHRDKVIELFSCDEEKDEALSRVSAAGFVMWITPWDEPIGGREFVYGKIRDHSLLPNNEDNTVVSRNEMGLNDPNLDIEGVVKPETGTGFVMDRVNDVYWHAVRKQSSEGNRVITIMGYL